MPNKRSHEWIRSTARYDQLTDLPNQLQTWMDKGIKAPISVNLSARTLHDGSFPDQVKELLEN